MVIRLQIGFKKSCHRIPVNHMSEGINVAAPFVLVAQVIGILPYIQCLNGFSLFFNGIHQGIILIGCGCNEKGTLLCNTEPTHSLPKRERAAWVKASLNASKEPKDASIFSPSFPSGAPPPSGDITFQQQNGCPLELDYNGTLFSQIYPLTLCEVAQILWIELKY